MKRPAFQFYPADWRNNANLRRCSPAARGVWMDVLCVLHDSDDYGIVKWPLVELASAAGANVKLIKELVDKRVLKGCDKGTCDPFIYTPRSGRKDGQPVTLIHAQVGPIWYSSRFVRDEYVRTIRGEASRFGDDKSDTNGAASKPSPKGGFGDGSTSSSSSSPTVDSEAKASAAEAAPFTTEKAAALSKEELWSAGKSLLEGAKVPKAQCGTFIGGLVKEFTPEIVIDVVRAAVVEVPADPRGWMRAACKTRAGLRPAVNRQEALEASNRAVGDRWLAAQGEPA